jgi:molybdopterin/thiamine biosynthesis adenylyltransferase
MVDGDCFAPSNLNRQLLCDMDGISRPKAQVAKEKARAANPLTEVEAFQSVLGEKNAEQLMCGMDLVLDALDNIEGRFVLAESAHRLKIPFIHAAATGWWGQISTFPAESSRNLASIYGERRSRDAAEISMGVPGPTPAVIGSLEAMEAIRILSGRKPAYANQLFYFDGESGRMEVLPL